MDSRGTSRSGAARVARTVLVVIVAILVAASLLPLIETNVWWIRFLDFARLQVAAALTVLVIALALLGAWRRPVSLVAIAAAAAALGYHGYRLHPYLPPLAEMAPDAPSCPQDASVRVMIANVQKTNRNDRALFDLAEQSRPDLLLLMETNEWWDRRIAAWATDFPHRVQHVPEEASFFGMHLLSRLPLVEPEVRFHFGAETPSIVSGVRLPDEQIVSFYGLHPRPPHYWSQPTTLRDGYILAAALEMSDAGPPGILAGDFNATPWERVNRRAMRLGGLLDPRVGRGLYPTYAADSWLITWPLDQILFQDGFALTRLERLPGFGSDHYPLLADLCHAPALAEGRSAPPRAPDDLQEAETSIEAARALGG